MAVKGPAFISTGAPKTGKKTELVGLPKGSSANKGSSSSKGASNKNSGKKGGKKGSGSGGVPRLNYDKLDDIAVDEVTAEMVDNEDFSFTDLDLDAITAPEIADARMVSPSGKVSADRLADRFMTAADYALIDPKDIAEEFGGINRDNMRANSRLSSELALEALDAELEGMRRFTPEAARIKRQLLDEDNQFNQTQRTRQLDQADPRLRTDLEGQAERARSFAEGRVPDAVQDKALELGVRSRAADRASAGGFGARSSAARKASELMSAEQRIGLSKYGDELLSKNVGQRGEMLLAPTQYSDAGAQVNVNPTTNAGQAALGLLEEANKYTNISATDALGNLTQQEQFRAGLEQETNKTNLAVSSERDLNQARLNLDAGQFNIDTQMKADVANQAADIDVNRTRATLGLQAQESTARNTIAMRELGSTERRFDVEQRRLTNTSNVDRKFQADSTNAGRKLEVGINSRNLQADFMKTNATFVFQDQQARRSEAAANARAAMSEAGANNRAAMSASLQREQMAQNLALMREDRAFQLEQQRLATQAAGKAQSKAESNNLINSGIGLLATVGTAIALS